MGAPRSTKDELEERYQEIENMVLAYTPRDKMLRYSTNKWGITENSFKEYLSVVWLRLREFNRPEREENIVRQLRKIESVIERARKNEDLHAELKAIEQQNKILGIYEITHKHEVIEPTGLSRQELISELSAAPTIN